MTVKLNLTSIININNQLEILCTNGYCLENTIIHYGEEITFFYFISLVKLLYNCNFAVTISIILNIVTTILEH